MLKVGICFMLTVPEQNWMCEVGVRSQTSPLGCPMVKTHSSRYKAG